jgi:small-conductance mechanosensitive channel/CRP-like cAMP-binding protein
MLDTLPLLKVALRVAGVGIATYAAIVACGHLFRRLRPLRFGWTYHAFAIVAGLAVGVAASPSASPWRAEWLHHLTAAAIVLAAFPVLVVLNHVLWTRTLPDGTRADAPTLLADTTRVLVVAAVALTVLQLFYGVKVPGLLAGSGVAAIILGLAMQDLLGNVMAGFALYTAKPFKTGDWLLVDGHHARVVELTWRSTRLVTLDDVLLDVPNIDLVKRPVFNFDQPTTRHAVSLKMGLDYAIPPARAVDVLQAAAASVTGVCADPPPCVLVEEFADSAVVYRIKTWIEDHGQYARVLSDVRSHCWYAVRRAGMEIPFPHMTLLRRKGAERADAAHATGAAALRANAIFGFLAEEQIASLLQRCPVVLFAPAERLAEQGTAGGSMFLLVRGAVEIRVARGGRMNVVAKLGPGDCLGEMSLLTGEPRSATAVARGEVEAVEITKDAFAALVRDNREILAHLSEIVAQRQLANQQIAAGDVEAAECTPAGILARLRALFELGR